MSSSAPAGKPKLVFVHGAGSNRGFWHEQQAAFPEALFPNLPGHTDARGEDAGAGRNSIEAYADWLEGWIEERAITRVALNGHSMGGAIALTLALRRPPWLQALVLTCTSARLFVSPKLLGLLEDDYPSAVDFIVGHSFYVPPGGPTYASRARLNGTRRQLLRIPQRVTLGDYAACSSFDVADRLGEIGVPTLCIAGERDRMVPPGNGEQLRDGIAGCVLALIENAGHMPPVEQPDAYNRTLVQFIQQKFGAGA